MNEKIAEFVDAMAIVVDLPLPAEYRDSVIANFERINTVAQLVIQFPLSEDLEAAPIFEP